MRLGICSLLLVTLSAGCHTAPASGPVDPFLGRTRVPPPSTGMAGGLPMDPSYHRGPGTSGSITPVPGGYSMAPDGDTSGAAVSYPDAAVASGAPAVSLGEVVSVVDGAPVTEKPDDPPGVGSGTSAAVASNRWSGQVTGGQPIVRTIHPRPAQGVSQQPTPARRPSVSPATSVSSSPRPTRVVNITELPRHHPAGAGHAERIATTISSGSDTTSRAGAFRLVAATAPSAEPERATTGGFGPAAGSYGYDTSYAWLRGRLEFSPIDQQWKLRYIPLDGETDDYGGSVVLEDEVKLAGCERGDFVEIHGRVLPEAPKSGFSPVYGITSLKRLGGSEG